MKARQIFREHPVIAWFFVFCLVGGVGACHWLLPGDWSALRRSAAGLISGAGVWLLITGPKLVG